MNLEKLRGVKITMVNNPVLFTADCHFNHENILKYEPNSRPFANVGEMNQAIIDNWNTAVREVADANGIDEKDINDNVIVYIVGDFFMGSINDIEGIYNQLLGHKILIRGNHDTNARIKHLKENIDPSIEVKDIDHFQYKGKYFIVCHFPIISEEFYNMMVQDNKEIIFCYGHVHGNAPAGYHNRAYHVGVDTNGLKPVSVEEIVRASNNE